LVILRNGNVGEPDVMLNSRTALASNSSDTQAADRL
jgi:hypothetical protein